MTGGGASHIHMDCTAEQFKIIGEVERAYCTDAGIIAWVDGAGLMEDRASNRAAIACPGDTWSGLESGIRHGISIAIAIICIAHIDCAACVYGHQQTAGCGED